MTICLGYSAVKNFIYFIFWVYVCAWVCVCAPHCPRSLWKKEVRRGVPRNRITDNLEPPCGYWELSLDPLLKLIWVLCTEPFLQLPGIQFDFKLNSYCVIW